MLRFSIMPTSRLQTDTNAQPLEQAITEVVECPVPMEFEVWNWDTNACAHSKLFTTNLGSVNFKADLSNPNLYEWLSQIVTVCDLQTIDMSFEL